VSDGTITDRVVAARASPATRAVSPVHVATAVVAATSLAATSRPVEDIDATWHVMLGREILSRHALHNLGRDWLAVTPPHSWTTSQWLSEVGMADIVDAVGWRGLVAAKLVLVAATLALTAAGLRGRHPLAAALPFSAVCVSMANVAAPRPQTVSLVLVGVLALAAVRLLTDGRRPPLPVVALLAVVWAQVHGLWVLAPAAFALIAIGHLLDGRRPAARSAAACLLASLAGVLNPLGPASFLLPLRLRDAGTFIAEWQRTTLGDPYTVAAAAVLVVTVVAWARRPDAVPRAEVLWVMGWAGFATLAYRNVVPALLLIVPVAAARIDRAWFAERPKTAPTRREAALLAAACAVTLVVGVVTAAVQTARLDPLGKLPALGIARTIAESPEPVRVFNAYNTSGSLIALSDGKARVMVDGRADLWGVDYLNGILAIGNAHPGWQERLDELAPDAVVISEDSALAAAIGTAAWDVVLHDEGYILLLPRGCPRLPCADHIGRDDSTR